MIRFEIEELWIISCHVMAVGCYTVSLPQMSPSQWWLFCQFDSRSGVTVPHSAVEMVDTPDTARPRTSVETRCLIRYND